MTTTSSSENIVGDRGRVAIGYEMNSSDESVMLESESGVNENTICSESSEETSDTASYEGDSEEEAEKKSKELELSEARDETISFVKMV